MQAAGADVLRRLIHLVSDVGERFDGVFRELQFDSVGTEQVLVLPSERRFRFGQNANEVVACQRLKFDTNWEAAL